MDEMRLERKQMVRWCRPFTLDELGNNRGF